MTEPTNEQTLPEMQPGSNGMYSISAEDGIKMGPAVLQAFMGKLREAAEIAQLEVKVEPLRGILMIWWYPKEESTFLTDVLQHMSAVPTGSMKAERKLLFADDVKNVEQLVEFFKMVSQTRLMHIEIKDTIDTDYLEIEWRPSNPLDFPPRTYLDAVAEEFDKAPSGELTASRKNMLESKKNMTEVMEYFMDVSSTKSLDIVADYAVDSDEVKISWRPLSEKHAEWWDGANGTPDEEDDEFSLKG